MADVLGSGCEEKRSGRGGLGGMPTREGEGRDVAHGLYRVDELCVGVTRERATDVSECAAVRVMSTGATYRDHREGEVESVEPEKDAVE